MQPRLIEKSSCRILQIANDLKGMQSLHFLVRDRVDDEVIFSFRVMVESKSKGKVKDKLSYKLGT
jgi:hypothetical protein